MKTLLTILLFTLITSATFAQQGEICVYPIYHKNSDTTVNIQTVYPVLIKANQNNKVCLNKPQTLKTPLEKILYTELAVVSYGVIDYFAYNMMKDWSVEHYRFIQGIAFAGINYLLNKYVSTSSAIGFSLQVWGGVPDMYYYGIDKVSGGFNGFSAGNEFSVGGYYSHLNFMPTVLGQDKVHGVDLIVNNIITKGISITLQFGL